MSDYRYRPLAACAARTAKLSGVPMVLLLMVIVLVGCPKRSPARYDFAPPPVEWAPMKAKDGTLLFRRQSPEMGIMVFPTCDRYLSAPLAPLSRDLFLGFRNKRVIKRGAAKVGGKEAHFVIMECTLEGTPVKVKAYTLKARRCIYDVAYFATPEKFNVGLETFEKFVQNFTAED